SRRSLLSQSRFGFIMNSSERLLAAVLQRCTINSLARLLLCIVVDLIGLASYLIPVLGEALDVVWAPLSAYCIRQLLPDPRLSAFAYVGFFEELMPGLDFIPTATIGWCYLQYLDINEHLRR
ncbi:hypothetical protein BVRB_022420, partial [Beta vulgaris subsp. vulgaris]